MIQCSWTLCKHCVNGECNHPNGVDLMVADGDLKVKNGSMIHCKLYSRKDD